MPRKPRLEVAGGLYHVITRGNNRRQIFNRAADYEKFLSLLAKQKRLLPFFLYAYCLMTNHVHLLIERQADDVGRIMQRVLTGYSQYYNRRHQRSGHLVQGRYKATLCQSERYLTELVRYIHLNPVRAGIVNRPEQYQYSSHRAYLGLEVAEIVDVDPVLRHFGARRERARAAYREFVDAGIKQGHREEFYVSDDDRILGSEEFVDATIHRFGETPLVAAGQRQGELDKFDAEALIEAIESVCGVSRLEFCGPGKSSSTIAAKELFVLISREVGASPKLLSEISGMSYSAVSRRYDAARLKLNQCQKTRKLADRIRKNYRRRESQKSQA